MISTKTSDGRMPTKLSFAMVMAFGFHVADGQNFGWLCEGTIMKRKWLIILLQIARNQLSKLE